MKEGFSIRCLKDWLTQSNNLLPAPGINPGAFRQIKLTLA
jgi:hypothetical protein